MKHVFNIDFKKVYLVLIIIIISSTHLEVRRISLSVKAKNRYLYITCKSVVWLHKYIITVPIRTVNTHCEGLGSPSLVS